jgi:hypothetical protein
MTKREWRIVRRKGQEGAILGKVRGREGVTEGSD